VSAQIEVGSGRVVVDRIQTFDGTDPALEGITLGLGAPVPAEVWVFPWGYIDEGITEQVVVYNPTDDVAEVEIEARLENPEVNGVPEPFEATVAPHGYQIVDLHEPDLEATEAAPRRIPDQVEHSIIVRSLNGVPIVAEKVFTRSAPQSNLGVTATLGAPLAAPIWLLPAGGVNNERDENVTIYNATTDEPVRFSVHVLDDGRTLEVQSLQDIEIPPGGFQRVSLRTHADLEELPLVVTADGPVVVERGLFRRSGRGISISLGIPIDQDTLVFDPLDS
jgi:hypothetical protein